MSATIKLDVIVRQRGRFSSDALVEGRVEVDGRATVAASSCETLLVCTMPVSQSPGRN